MQILESIESANARFGFPVIVAHEGRAYYFSGTYSAEHGACLGYWRHSVTIPAVYRGELCQMVSTIGDKYLPDSAYPAGVKVCRTEKAFKKATAK